MAVGGQFAGITASLASGSFQDIRPAASHEAVITLLAYSGAVILYLSDGTTNIEVDSDGSAGSMLGRNYHVSNSLYYRLYNNSGGSISVAYEGLYTIDP